MFDDFFTRALVAAVGIALMTGPLGCFVVWQRLAYFGDTMSHSALLGVAFGLLVGVNTTFSVFAIALAIAIALYCLQRREKLSSDSILGILSHATLAIGLVLVGFMTWVRFDLMGYLFGDILAASKMDIILIWGGCFVVISLLLFLWRPLLTMTVNEDLAVAENMRPALSRFAIMIILALVIAVAMKLVGILLITALLIIPSATARRFSKGPEQMALLAALIGVIGSVAGLYGSFEFDTSSGPTIVTTLFCFFLLSRLLCWTRKTGE